MESKQNLGQFYTTNYEYILQNLNIPEGVCDIIEPFAGMGDLLKFLDTNKYNLQCYDIDPKQSYIQKRDTLLDPPDFNNKYVITNPPYLARNKSTNKSLFDKYNCNDLYKCFIQIIINCNCLGGILIVPLNFFCSIRKNDIQLRQQFLTKYDIIHINIFEERVFDDTSYTICSFQFQLKSEESLTTTCLIYPSKKTINFVLNSKNNYLIGGEIYHLPQTSNYKIERGTKKTTNLQNITNILAKCIDDNINNKVGLSIVDDTTKNKYIDTTANLTSRSYATLVITPSLSIEKQRELVEKFNNYFNEYREKYHSLFLTNYRESNSIARKRISFSLTFQIINYLLLE